MAPFLAEPCGGEEDTMSSVFDVESLIENAKKKVDQVYDEGLARLLEERNNISRFLEEELDTIKREMLKTLKPA